MRQRGEGSWFADVYKSFITLGEWFIKPLFNFLPPRVARHRRDVPYADAPRNRKQRLDIEVPLGEGPFPVLVYVHGGGFISMDKSHYTRIAKTFAAAGYLVYNINYRRAPRFRFPLNITDVGTAIAWAVENAASYGGDPETVFLAGDSAGAHLISTYATALADAGQAMEFRLTGVKMPGRLCGLILFYGAFDCETVLQTGFPFVRLMLTSFLSRDPEIFQERAGLASPIRHLSGDYPPCFICYAARDALAGESVAFARALASEGVESDVLVISEEECRVIPHGFVNLYWRSCAKKAMASAISFLDAHR
jgi:acetyl esterase